MTQNTSLDQIKEAEQHAANTIDDVKAKNTAEISQKKQEMEMKIKQASELIENDKLAIIADTKKRIENIRTDAKKNLETEISKIENISENTKEEALKLIINKALAE